MNQTSSKKRQAGPRKCASGKVLEAAANRSAKTLRSEQRRSPVAVQQNAGDLYGHAKRKFEKPLPEILQNDPILGSKQTAKALNISAVHLRRLVRAKKIPPPLIVGCRKFGWRLATIMKMRAEREVEVRDE